MSRTCYLRIGDDTLEDAKRHQCQADAHREFASVARGLARFGQRIEATLHLATNRDELVEYPDYVLSIGPRGGLRRERA